MKLDAEQLHQRGGGCTHDTLEHGEVLVRISPPVFMPRDQARGIEPELSVDLKLEKFAPDTILLMVQNVKHALAVLSVFEIRLARLKLYVMQHLGNGVKLDLHAHSGPQPGGRADGGEVPHIER